ncbi:MAG: hypothetical protein IPQ17_07220 [Xanthomonadales bacterium]|nr:hypothetical protein [Xanthomonadales bacterium]
MREIRCTADTEDMWIERAMIGPQVDLTETVAAWTGVATARERTSKALATSLRMTDTPRGNAATLASCHAGGLADVHTFDATWVTFVEAVIRGPAAGPVGSRLANPGSDPEISPALGIPQESSPVARSSEAFYLHLR